ncbi:anaerobic ribonucleoside-triphosphate reductase [Agathobaculum butyriciproducens]|jgi:ribonucleoside-triphosphate reductase|nr:anaerobic ribonucleoside-triphosphate reductase [Agathobaculum butyriciproducens]
MKIRKRNGSEVDFNHSKITKAILKANVSVGVNDRLTEAKAEEIAKSIEAKCMTANTLPSVESVQDMVVYALMKVGAYHLANNYITYRYKHELLRKANSTDAKILSIVDGSNAEAKEENANKNPEIVSVQCDYIAGEVSRDITERLLLPAEITAAHKEGIIHFHDGDYFIKHAYNCCLVNLEDMLQNGTVISGTKIDKPHLFSTACNISTQIIAQVASNTYGGQTISLTHLASFVNESRKRFRAQVIEELTDAGIPFTDEQVDSITEKRVRKDVEKGIQTIQYQVVTLMTTNGQAPFITVFLYLNECGDNQQLRDDLAMCIEEMLKQRIQGVKNKVGVWVTPAFPKLIYVLEEDNIHEDSKYWELTKLAAKCSAKRLVPDYISEKVMKQLKVDANGDGQCFPAMGCRSFLMPYIDPETNKPKYYGRFNQGVVTISLPDVALSSGGDMQEFWRIFEERLELCHRALRCRHERLKGTLTDIAPILWQDGAIARMTSGETIDKLLYGNYSTISLGYAGLFECVKYMTGKSHTDESAKSFALAVMQKMNDKCEEWRKAENIGYSLYGTPLESTTYKFAKCLRHRFGVIKDVTDHDYITNSYHVNVREPIDAFSKLKFEAEFQKLSPGGAVSYVEVPNLQNNIETVLAIIKFIYDTIMYAELNCKSDYCQVCGFDGEIKIVTEGGKLIWECPNCGNRDQHRMNVTRRTCGYIGTQFWNQGRTQEIRDRVIHVSVPK